MSKTPLLFERLHKLVSAVNKKDTLAERREVVAKYKDDPEICEILSLTYGHTGFGTLPVGLPPSDALYDQKDFLPWLRTIPSKAGTNAARQEIANWMASVPESSYLVLRIMNKNLEIRLNRTQLNKAIPGVVPTYDVPLAETYSPNRVKKEELHLWRKMRKYDGLRLSLSLHINPKAKTAKAYTREGVQFTTVDHLLQEILRTWKGDSNHSVVFDGELVSPLSRTESFSEIVSQWKRKEHQITEYSFVVWDVLTPCEFAETVQSPPWFDRLERLKNFEESDYIVPVVTEPITEEELEDEFKTTLKTALSRKWEGIMLRKNVPYRSGRSLDLLKVKPVLDAEFPIVGIVSNERRVIRAGQPETYETVVRKLVVEVRGFQVGVGTGLSLEQRIQIHADPDAYIGKLATVRFTNYSQNKKGEWSLRNPRLVHIWDSETREV